MQNESPFGDETQVPPFLHGLGEHDIKPAKQTREKNIINLFKFNKLSLTHNKITNYYSYSDKYDVIITI